MLYYSSKRKQQTRRHRLMSLYMWIQHAVASRIRGISASMYGNTYISLFDSSPQHSASCFNSSFTDMTHQTFQIFYVRYFNSFFVTFEHSKMRSVVNPFWKSRFQNTPQQFSKICRFKKSGFIKTAGISQLFLVLTVNRLIATKKYKCKSDATRMQNIFRAHSNKKTTENNISFFGFFPNAHIRRHIFQAKILKQNRKPVYVPRMKRPGTNE